MDNLTDLGRMDKGKSIYPIHIQIIEEKNRLTFLNHLFVI
jgi:hypothetical protein